MVLILSVLKQMSSKIPRACSETLLLHYGNIHLLLNPTTNSFFNMSGLLPEKSPHQLECSQSLTALTIPLSFSMCLSTTMVTTLQYKYAGVKTGMFMSSGLRISHLHQSYSQKERAALALS